MKPPTGHWILDPSRSTVSFRVRNYLVRTVEGRFHVLAGSADLTDDAGDSSLEVVIDTTSFDTGHGKRDHHVKGGEFLAADRHPQGTFTSSCVAPTADGYRAVGLLALGPGRTTVEFDLCVDRVEPDARTARDMVTFRASARLDRRSLGITRLYGFVVSNAVTVEVRGVANRA